MQVLTPKTNNKNKTSILCVSPDIRDSQPKKIPILILPVIMPTIILHNKSQFLDLTNRILN